MMTTPIEYELPWSWCDICGPHEDIFRWLNKSGFSYSIKLGECSYFLILETEAQLLKFILSRPISNEEPPYISQSKMIAYMALREKHDKN